MIIVPPLLLYAALIFFSLPPLYDASDAVISMITAL